MSQLRQQKAEEKSGYGAVADFGRASQSSFSGFRAGSRASSSTSLAHSAASIPSPRQDRMSFELPERERERASRTSHPPPLKSSAKSKEEQRTERRSGESDASSRSAVSGASDASSGSMWSRTGKDRWDRASLRDRTSHEPPVELSLKELRQTLDIALVDDRVQYAFDRYILTDAQLHSEPPGHESDDVLRQCAPVLARHRIRLRKLFHFFGAQDPSRKFMDLREFVYMVRALSLTNQALRLDHAARIAVAAGGVLGLTNGRHLSFREFGAALCHCAIAASQSGLLNASSTAEEFFVSSLFPAAAARTTLVFAPMAKAVSRGVGDLGERGT